MSTRVTCFELFRRASLLSPLWSALLAVGFLSAAAFAEREPTPAEIESMRQLIAAEEGLNFQTGTFPLKHGQVEVTTKEGFRFLDSKSATKVIVELWGNPPAAAEGILGMLVPPNVQLVSGTGWAVVIKASDEGHIKDEEFENADFNKLLTEMKEASAEASKEREKAGYGKLELVGWATAPRYDKAAHKVHWAKELSSGEAENTLNYEVRVLGRQGYVSVNSVAGVKQLREIEAASPTILSMVNYTKGNLYADFNPSTDKLATYGILGLIAGGMAGKAGLFAKIGLILAKFSKVIIVGVVALFGAVAKLFGARKQQ
jgi:uncharacterized membrane-anchored protein